MRNALDLLWECEIPNHYESIRKFAKLGDRVGAVKCVVDRKLFLYGTGIYVGRKPKQFHYNPSMIDWYNRMIGEETLHYMECVNLDTGGTIGSDKAIFLPIEIYMRLNELADKVITLPWVDVRSSI